MMMMDLLEDERERKGLYILKMERERQNYGLNNKNRIIIK